jgi:hypothetical protein
MGIAAFIIWSLHKLFPIIDTGCWILDTGYQALGRWEERKLRYELRAELPEKARGDSGLCDAACPVGFVELG